MTSDLGGFIDPHVHAAPEHIPRLLNDLELVREARAAGMRGVLIKSHTTLTADRATIAHAAVPGIDVWGGLALNRVVGGWNREAVENAIAYGAAEIWMPTIDATADPRWSSRPGRGLTPLGSDGRITEVVGEILEIIAHADVILGTGHLSAPETVAVVRAAQERGVRKILITHPEAPFIAMPITTQVELARRGCHFERTWVFTTPALGAVLSPEYIVESIRAVGPSSTVLATDMGQVGNPPPVDGLRAFLQACREGRIAEEDVRHMATQIGEWLPVAASN